MNFVPFAFVLTVSLLCHIECENINLTEFDERAAIVNGCNAPNRPFYVAVLIQRSHTTLCGGTIITEQNVLTAVVMTKLSPRPGGTTPTTSASTGPWSVRTPPTTCPNDLAPSTLPSLVLETSNSVQEFQS